MEREKRDLYDEYGQPTGETYLKGDKILQGRYAMVVMACINICSFLKSEPPRALQYLRFLWWSYRYLFKKRMNFVR